MERPEDCIEITRRSKNPLEPLSPVVFLLGLLVPPGNDSPPVQSDQMSLSFLTKAGKQESMKQLLMTSVLASALCIGYAQQPDNTRVNKEAQPTADQPKSSKGDLKITQQIRREIVKDKTLSTDAHNVKVVVTDGKVTLKGPVKSDQEKTAIQEKTAAIAGAGNVTNDLTVKGS